MRKLLSEVSVRTPEGRFDGVIVGRTIEQFPTYDVRTRCGVVRVDSGHIEDRRTRFIVVPSVGPVLVKGMPV